jgi:ubiquinone/menaquinone biosynthesis C-methylase UbiE
MEYVGGDISLEMMQVCLEKYAGIRKAFDLVQLDGTALPFPDRAFDAVLSFKFLSLLPQEIRLEVLREFRRVTRRYLIAQSQHLRTFCPWRALKLLFAKVFGIEWRTKKYQTRGELLPQIESVGFRTVARIRIIRSFLDVLWPFDLEYLAVLEVRDEKNPH